MTVSPINDGPALRVGPLLIMGPKNGTGPNAINLSDDKL